LAVFSRLDVVDSFGNCFTFLERLKVSNQPGQKHKKITNPVVDMDLLLIFNCSSSQVLQTALLVLLTFLMQSNFLMTSVFKFVVSDVTDLWHNIVKFKLSFE